jgi:glycosyltransferase involved in cell wall biosynthesis
LKILYHHRIASKDGQVVHVEAILAALRRNGDEVHVVSPPLFDKVGFGSQATWLTRLRQALPRAVYELLEICYNVPVLWRLRCAINRVRPDLIYERYNLFVVTGVLIARLHKIPIFLEVNAPTAQERAAYGGLSLASLAAWIERRTWRAVDFVLPVSHVLAEIVRQSGVPAERVSVIPNGIEDENLNVPSIREAKEALGLQGKTVLGFVGFVREWHGLADVLELLVDPRCPPEAHLLVVGDGPALPDLKRSAAQLGIAQRVTFAGLVDRTRLTAHIAAFDIALQPKAVGYASPLKIFEYMAAGKAIAAPDQANIREILTHGESALLFDSADPASFREAVLLLASDSVLRARLGARARSVILERRYTWDENARRIGSLHARIAGERGTGEREVRESVPRPQTSSR